MRKELISVFLAGFLWQSQAASQSGNAVQISLEVKDVTVEYVLNEIEAMSNYHFLYNHKLVDVDRKVSLSVDEENIDSVLTRLFEGTDVSYQMSGKQIVLARKSLIGNGNVSSGRQQQTQIVTGIITDKTGEPVIGANIVVKGTTNGTISGLDGRFSLEIRNNNAVLQVSYIGYLNQTITVGNQKELNIRLVEDTKSLEEVVVVGYGTQKKEVVTAAITSVKAYDNAVSPCADVAAGLAGRLSGVIINTRSGEVGNEGTSIFIRGKSTYGSNTEPLYIVDGIARSEEGGLLSKIDANDIESISVLKDASAAIYGSRAANGVVLITTKRGKEGMKPTLNISSMLLSK